MPLPQVIFVRGNHTEPEFPWMYFHFDPFRDDPVGEVDLIYFDYPDGTRKIWRGWTPVRARTEPASPDETDPLTPKVHIRLRDRSLDTGPERGSVLALYDWITTQPADTILSLQVFSHAWFNGPVIWADSYETEALPDPAEPRDPNDTEFRPRDFFGSNPLAGTPGQDFVTALKQNAFIKFWGCNEGRYWEDDADPPPETGLTGVPWRRMIKKYMKAPRGARGDGIRSANLDSYLDWVEQNFQFVMTTKLGVPVWAGPLGWGSTPWNDRGKLKWRKKYPPNLKRDLWWRMSAAFTGMYRKFYRDVLKTPIDAVGYIKYERSWFDTARALVTAEAAPPSRVTSPRDLQQRLLDRIDQLMSRRT